LLKNDARAVSDRRDSTRLKSSVDSDKDHNDVNDNDNNDE